MFAHQGQFAPGQFTKGNGTPYPVPALALAQIYRYWWSVESWRIAYSITDSNAGQTYATDTGFIPYGCGWDGASITARRWLIGSNGGGDSMQAPRNSDRYLPVNIGAGDVPGPKNFFIEPVQGAYIFVEMFAPVVGGVASGGCVFEDDSATSAYMSFFVSGTMGFGIFTQPANSPGDGTVDSGIVLTLDGIQIPIYTLSFYNFLSGSITISTRDT